MANPMYREIADRLREQIEAGEFKSGAQMPTEQDLQTRFTASRNTIRDAVKQLTALGLVETRPGQGTFVVTDDPSSRDFADCPPQTGVDYTSKVFRAGGEATASEIQVEIQEATFDVAAGLGLEAGTEVISRHRRHFIKPWALQTSFDPEESADRDTNRLRRAPNIDDGAVTYLRNFVKFRQVGCRDWDTACEPNSTAAGLFELPSDGRGAADEIYRAAFEGNGQSMWLTITVSPVNRNQYMADIGDSPVSGHRRAPAQRL